jgi:hypothetical protein
MAKRIRTKPKAATPPPPVNYVIRVKVDKAGNFDYKVGSADGKVVLTRPNSGDTISWSVTKRGKHKPFQIEFEHVGPFGAANRVIRSKGDDTPALEVKVPPDYTGPIPMKYQLTVEGAWSDDPDIVPILSDGFTGLAKDPPVVKVSHEGATIKLDPPATQAAVNQWVLWKWEGSSDGEYTITFTGAPGDWKNPLTSVGGVAAGKFPSAKANVKYTLKLNNFALSADGHLTVTP